jgi:hypothetical protein
MTTVNGSADGRVHFRTDPATGSMMVWQGENVKTVAKPGKRVAETGETATRFEDVSPAKRRLLALQGTVELLHAERVEVPDDPEPYFVRAVDLAGLTSIGILSARDASGRLNLAEASHGRSLQAAMLFVCCVSGEADFRPFFASFGEAYAFASMTTPAGTRTNALLFSAIARINPEILTRPDGGPGEAAPLAKSRTGRRQRSGTRHTTKR